MDGLVKRLRELLRLVRLLQAKHPCADFPLSALVKLQEEIGPGPLAVGEAIQHRQGRRVGQPTQFVHEVLGGAIEADVYDRLFADMGGFDEIQAENGRQAAGVVVPDDVVADEEPAQNLVQLRNPGAFRGRMNGVAHVAASFRSG